jgi:two-component system, cell cycle sensor histidine kinase and response regulator CckA
MANAGMRAVPDPLPPPLPAADDIIRDLFELPAAAVVVVDRAGRIRDANDAFRAAHADDALAAVTPWLGDLWSGVLRRLDVEVEIPCGSHQRLCRVQAALADLGEECVAVVVFAKLCSWRAAGDPMLAELIDLTTDWIWQCDAGARYTFASARIRDFLGYEPREVIGKTACDFMAPPDAPRAAAVLRTLLAEPRSFARVELLCRHRDGRNIALEVTGIPLIDADGVLHGYRGVVRDVSEREAQKRALDRLVAAIDHAGDVVMIADREARIEYVNPAFEHVTGYRSADVVGRRPSILKSGLQPAEFYEAMWGELGAGRQWSGHFINKRSDGTLYHADATISPIFGDAAEITGFVAVQRDVTETLALLDQLRSAGEMERFGKLVSGVAHEVRNPLNAIQAAAAALELDSGNDPEARPLFHIVRSQVDRLAQLMRDLLIIAKPVHQEWLQRWRARDVVAEAVAEWRIAHPEAPPARVSLRLVRDGPVWVDASRMQQVIVNLLDNAAQHSDAEAKIVIVVEHERERCRIAVRDAGSGVTPANLDHVFEPFFTTRRGGTGLGLSLVKSIVEQHGGSVSLRSNEPSPGCTAEVVLPVPK